MSGDKTPWVVREDLDHPMVRWALIGLLVTLLFGGFNYATTGDWDGHPGETCREDIPQGSGYDCYPDEEPEE
jgi:hypothetical protein